MAAQFPPIWGFPQYSWHPFVLPHRPFTPPPQPTWDQFLGSMPSASRQNAQEFVPALNRPPTPMLEPMPQNCGLHGEYLRPESCWTCSQPQDWRNRQTTLPISQRPRLPVQIISSNAMRDTPLDPHFDEDYYPESHALDEDELSGQAQGEAYGRVYQRKIRYRFGKRNQQGDVKRQKADKNLQDAQKRLEEAQNRLQSVREDTFEDDPEISARSKRRSRKRKTVSSSSGEMESDVEESSAPRAKRRRGKGSA